MTSYPNQRLPLAVRLQRQAAQTWRTLFAPGDWLTLIIAFVLLFMPVMALSAAGWPLELRTIVPVTAFSLGFGFLLARSQYNELLALILSAVYGVAFIFLAASINEPGNLLEGFSSVITRLVQWSVAAATGGLNQDDLIFTMLVGLLFWFLGLAMLVLFVSGIIIWRAYFSHYFPIGVIRLGAVLHAAFAAVMIIAIIVHVYAAIWVRGTIRAMLYGTVTRAWAKQHHRAWYRQVTGK